VPPDIGLSLQYGNQLGAFERALGFVLSFDYGMKTAYQDAEYFAVVSRDASPVVETLTESSTTTADWGLLANATLRLGSSHTLGIKNLITQESEEFVVVRQSAFNPDVEYNFGPLVQRHQVRYIERGFLQSQLRGQHRFTWPFATTWDWNATVSNANRDEPENRSLTYLNDGGLYRLDSWKPNDFWFRFLQDRTLSANLDISVPLGRWFGDEEALLKLGGGTRRKHRDFDGWKFSLVPAGDNLPDGEQALALPPEQVVAPENMGRNVRADPGLPDGLPYVSDDNVTSAYIMGDVPLFGGLRFVGGARVESWALDMLNLQPPAGKDSVALRNNVDIMPSGNLILALGEQMNLRAAAYQTVSRPDPREIALGVYAPVAGQCTQSGNPDLVRARIINADLRWEWYPAPGEIVSLSGFYKLFDDPIVEYVSLTISECMTSPQNARVATTAGGEIEMRKSLGFVAPSLENLVLGLNFTYADGVADLIIGNTINERLALQDLSRYVVNANLGYLNSDAGFSASVLYSYFDDRVSLYGNFDGNGLKTPDIVEEGRGVLDFKVTKRIRGVTASLSGKNLTNEVAREIQLTDFGTVPVGVSRIGTSFSLSLGYAF
jgi:hypothetical protein